MARLISEILGAPEPAFTHEVARLESLAGHPKIDIKLISDLVGQWQDLAGRFGLDVNDTHAQELYAAMKLKVLEDNAKLGATSGLTDQDTPEKVVKTCVKYVNDLLGSRPVWALKASVAKNELKKNPPKKTLKILGLRSLDSAVRREPVSQLLVFASMIESKTWKESYSAQAAKLRNSDFDKKKIDISIIDRKRTDRMKKSGYGLNQFLYRHDETGGICVVIPNKRFKADVLYFVDALLRGSNDIRRYSALAKLLSVRGDFSTWLASIRARGLDGTGVRYFNFGWSPVHHLLHKNASHGKPALFEPHLDHDDVRLNHHTQDGVWDCHYLLKTQDGVVVSCNLSDVIWNTANDVPAEQSSTIYGRRTLYDEIFSRYMEHDSVLEDFLKRVS